MVSTMLSLIRSQFSALKTSNTLKRLISVSPFNCNVEQMKSELTHENELSTKFVLRKFPREPTQPLTAFERFKLEKSKEFPDDDPMKHFQSDKIRHAWSVLDEDLKKQYFETALEEVVKYRAELTTYKRECSRTLTLGQLIEWLQSPSGKDLVREFLKLTRGPSKNPEKKTKSATEKLPKSGAGGKRAPTAYNFYLQSFKGSNPPVPLTAVAKQWKNLSAEDKKPFVKMAEKAKNETIAQEIKED